MIERRYYLSRLPVGVKCIARTVRGHWDIENSCHWRQDLTFREDEARIRDRNLREDFASLSRFLLSLIKRHPSKNSVVGKRRSCAWNDDFSLEVSHGSKHFVATDPGAWPWGGVVAEEVRKADASGYRTCRISHVSNAFPIGYNITRSYFASPSLAALES